MMNKFPFALVEGENGVHDNVEKETGKSFPIKEWKPHKKAGDKSDNNEVTSCADMPVGGAWKSLGEKRFLTSSSVTSDCYRLLENP